MENERTTGDGSSDAPANDKHHHGPKKVDEQKYTKQQPKPEQRVRADAKVQAEVQLQPKLEALGGANAKVQAEMKHGNSSDCHHYSNQDICCLNNYRLQILSCKGSVFCELCQEDTGSKGNKKKKKRSGGSRGAAAKEQAKAEKGRIWVCLGCTHTYCCDADTKPNGHLKVHCLKNKHWLAATYDEPTSIYCFKCRVEVLLQPPDSSPLQKNTTEALKELKDESVDWEWKSDSEWDSDEQMTTPQKLKDDMGPKDPEHGHKTEASSELKDERLTRTSDTDWDRKMILKPSLPTDKADIAIPASSACMERKCNIIKGIPNLKYTCFLNSMLQIVLAVNPLRHEILGSGHWPGRLCRSLKQLFDETSIKWKKAFPFPTLDPLPFYKTICSEWPVFKDGDMEDSCELIVLLLDALHVEEIAAKQLSIDSSNSEMATTVVDSIFRGQGHFIVYGIECGHGSSKIQDFLTLPIPIGKPESARDCSSSSGDNELYDPDAPVSIEDCLALYTEQSILPDWYCEVCTKEAKNNKSEREGTAQMKSDVKDIEGKEIMEGGNKKKPEKVVRAAMTRSFIASAPNVLVISLNRFIRNSDNPTEKVECHVCFKEQLDIQPYMEERSENSVYRLVAIAEHRGNLATGGHYVAYVRRSGSKSWFCANDCVITKASLQEVLRCQAYILVYERCSADAFESCVNVADEELDVIDTDMWPQTGFHIPIPPPIDEMGPWEVQRHPKRDQRRERQLAKNEPTMLNEFWRFLDGFPRSGDAMPYYRGLLLSMIQMDFGLHELNIPYSHLLSYSRSLAMDVCNNYDRLRAKLSETAREYMRKLTKGLNVAERVKKLMQQLEVKFLEMPKEHGELKKCLGMNVLRKTNFHGQNPAMIPVPEKVALIQALIVYVLSKHRDGFSWEGDFQIDDIDVYDNNVVITRSPKLFEINPEISLELVAAMEKDFSRIGTIVNNSFSYPDLYVPYLKPFCYLMSSIGELASWWSHKVGAEALREWIQHHPFLKVSMARSNLLRGIHAACRAYDPCDDTALFKKLLEDKLVTGWTTTLRRTTSRMLMDVFQYKDPSEDESYYQDQPEYLFEYFRHLSQHGTQSTFEFKPLVRRWDGPRRQLIQSLDELELAGASRLEYYVVSALIILISHGAMKGMLLTVWECYKR